MHIDGYFVVPGRYKILYLGCGRLVSLGVLVTVKEPAKASARSSRPLWKKLEQNVQVKPQKQNTKSRKEI